MRKLNLQLGSIKEMLSKEQMKKVIGGYTCGGDGTSTIACECKLADGTIYGSTNVTCANDDLQSCTDQCTAYCNSVHPV